MFNYLEAITEKLKNAIQISVGHMVLELLVEMCKILF